jgi:adenine-specific DNA-methyltransferase
MSLKKITPDSPEAKSADLIAENIEKLKTLFPELITEGPEGISVNVDVLKQLVGDKTVTDCDEKYGLNWFGKRRARQLALTPSTGTLRPAPEDSENWDTTQNIFIEGDNLEVLKLLQKSYAGKVKLIYIDPPYNTGKDFVYKDDFRDNIKNYKRLTGQVDEEGSPLTTNTETSGRFHTDWLNMMYPRLKLARNLLRDDGVICISADDSEASNLRKVCDEVFGEEQFVAQFTWETKRAARGVPPKNLLMHTHEYIICYARIADNVRFRGLDRDESDFANPDNDPRGLWRSESMKATGSQDNYFTITDPKTGNKFYGNWAFSESTVKKMIDDGLVLFPKSKDGVPRQKKFFDSYTNETKAAITALGWHSTENSTKQLMAMFDQQKVFDFPKPLSLIKFIVEQLSTDKDIVVDFFAGSGTTGHVVMAQNAADGGNRRYILVQLPEPLDPEKKEQKVAAEYCDKLGKPRTIAELTKERLRRAAKKIKEEYPDWNGDTGFRVFKLDSSNIKAWNPRPEDLEASLLDSVEHIEEGRTEADLLYELLLKLGLDLCVPIEQRQIAGKTVYSIGGGVLMACLDNTITTEQTEALGQGIVEWHKELAPAGDTTCVFLDNAFENDVAKTNLASILEQGGIPNVRSL